MEETRWRVSFFYWRENFYERFSGFYDTKRRALLDELSKIGWEYSI